MKSQFLCTAGVALAFCLAAADVQPAHSANINTGLSECQPLNTMQNTLVHDVMGVRNATDTSAWVICSLPRSPLPANALFAAFQVMGFNGDGHTLCTVYSFDEWGTFLGAGSFQMPLRDTGFSWPVRLATAQLPTFSFTYLMCILPRGSMLSGVVSLQ